MSTFISVWTLSIGEYEKIEIKIFRAMLSYQTTSKNGDRKNSNMNRKRRNYYFTVMFEEK